MYLILYWKYKIQLICNLLFLVYLLRNISNNCVLFYNYDNYKILIGTTRGIKKFYTVNQ